MVNNWHTPFEGIAVLVMALDSERHHRLLMYTLNEATAALLQVPACPNPSSFLHHTPTASHCTQWCMRHPTLSPRDTPITCREDQWPDPDSELATLFAHVLWQGFLNITQAIEMQVGITPKAFHADDLQRARHLIRLQ